MTRHTVNHHTKRLVARARAGDPEAAEELNRIYSDRILRLVRLRMGPELRVKMQSMDVVQDALLGAFRDLDNFTYKNEGDFLRWVSSIAENRIRDHIEHFHAQKRDHRKEIPLIQDSTESSSRIRFDPMDLTTPSMIMARKEDLDNLETAMDKLKPEYREVILLTRIDGLSYKEAAEKMKRSEGSVRMLLVRALSSLSSLLEGEDA